MHKPSILLHSIGLNHLVMNRYLLLFVLLLAMQLGSAQKCSHQHGSFKTSHASRLDTMDILHHHFQLDFTTFSAATFKGHSQMQVRIVQPTSQLHFDLEGLSVDSVKIGGVNYFFDLVNQGFVVLNAGAWITDDTVQVDVWYGGHPITDPTWGGFYYNSQYAYNMGVGFDADPHCLGRAWHPCIDDFNDRATYDIEVETLTAHRAICGGILISEEVLPNTHRRSSWHLEQPIPSYLASVAIGSYVHTEDEWVSEDGDVLPIWLASKATDTTNFKNSLINLPQVLGAYENHFGPYPFDRVGYVAVPFNGGAMEHATNIAYPLFAINGNTAYETLYAHELSHMWWGDAVTCVAQEEMWLNEGWASYCESLALEALYGVDAYNSEQSDLHREVLTSAHVTDGGYYAVSGVPHSVTYGTTVYRKGAWVVHSLRGIMGDVAFFQACRDYQAQHAFQSHSSIQLRDFFQSYTAQNLTAFFDSYVFQPGFTEFRIVDYTTVSADAPGYFWTNVHVENHLHRQTEYCSSMQLEVGFKRESGVWEYRTMIQDELFQSHMFLLDFQPMDVVLNPNETIHQSVLAQEKWMDQTGTHDLTYAELTLVLNDMGNSDSIWVRVENHFAEANYSHSIPGTNWRLSGDRMYEVHLSDTAGIDIAARMKFQANNAARYDTLLFADLNANGLNEDSLHLMYRPFVGGEWTLYPYATVNTMGSAVNGTGRFDITKLLPGQYTFGFRSGTIGVFEETIPNKTALWKQMGNGLELMQDLNSIAIFTWDGKELLTRKNVKKGDVVDISLFGNTLVKGMAGDQVQVQKIILH